MDNQNPLNNNNIVLKNILCVDLGTKRTGFAFKPGGLTLCVPLDAVQADSSETALLELIKEKNADVIVIGIAFSSTGADTPMSLKARAFSSQVQSRLTHLPEIKVVFQDESFSSIEAESNFSESKKLTGKKQGAKSTLKNRKLGTIDSLAAVEILKAYLLENHIGISL